MEAFFLLSIVFLLYKHTNTHKKRITMISIHKHESRREIPCTQRIFFFYLCGKKKFNLKCLYIFVLLLYSLLFKQIFCVLFAIHFLLENQKKSTKVCVANLYIYT